MAESIGTARLDIVVDTSSLDAGVSKAKRGTSEIGKSAQEAAQRVDSSEKRKVAALEKSIATYGKSRAEVIRWRIEQLKSSDAAATLTAKLDAQTRRVAATNTIFERAGFSAGRMIRQWAGLTVAAVSVGAAVASIKNSVDFADQLNDINQRLGISAEALSGWAYAAKQTGTDIDGLGVGLRRLAKNMGDAANPTSSQAKLFAALGVNVKDAQGNLRDLEDVLPEIATKFKSIQNETLKAGLAQEVFGKSGGDLIEFLNQGADGLDVMRERARELGVEFSQGTLASADEFNDRMGDLKSAALGLSTQIAQALLPELTKLVNKLTDLVADGDRTEQFVSDLSTVVSGTAKVFEFAAGQVSVMIGQLAALKSVASGVINLDWGQISRGLATGMAAQGRVFEPASQLLSGRSSSSRAASPAAEGMDITLGAPMSDAERAAFERRLTGALGGGGGGSKRSGKPEKSEAEKQAERLQRAYESLAARQREQISLFGQEGEAAKVRYEIEHGALKGLSEAKQRELVANAEFQDQQRKDAEFARERERADAAHSERFKTILDDMQTESDLLGKSIEQQEEYIKLKYLGADANEVERQAVIEGNKAYHERLRLISRQTELMDTFRTEASSALSDVITGTKSLSDAFKDMFDNIAERITQMIADRWIEQLFGQQGTTNTGGAGGWFGALMGVFAGGYAKGGAFMGGSEVQAFATGGVVSGPTMFPMRKGWGLMGEAGPEAIMPLERGSDGRLGVSMVGGGGGSSYSPTLNQTFVVSGTPDRRTREQMARDSGRQAARGMARTGR